MRHTLVGWAYRGQLEMHPTPFARHPRRSHRCRIPAGVEVTNAITRIGAARFDSAGEHPALSRGWRPIAEDRDRESARGHDHNRVCLRATPAEFSAQPLQQRFAPVGAFFVPQRSFRLRLRRSMDRLLPVSLRPLELSAVPRVDVVSSLAQELKRGPDPRLWRQAVSRRKTPAITGVR